jgi:hypothetical protein
MKISRHQHRSLWAVVTAAVLGLCVKFSAHPDGATLRFEPKPVVVTLRSGMTGAEIQQALDLLPDAGGEVVLPAGNYEVSQPIVLRRDHQTLRGVGRQTVLSLADGANCPVIIMGEPVNHPGKTVKHLLVSGLSVDGNRSGQQRELWRLTGEGSDIRNNGITIQAVDDSAVENVTCAHCRSGGLVTTLGVRRLKVDNLEAYDNEFDGMACYLTTDCQFSNLYLHDNPGAGISLDLAFEHNVVSHATLVANDLGIFMRSSRKNRFDHVAIVGSHHFGVFMAHAEEETARGWGPAPETECADNAFTNLSATNCGGAAFRVNSDNCTNNVIVCANFVGNHKGGISQAGSGLVRLE